MSDSEDVNSLGISKNDVSVSKKVKVTWPYCGWSIGGVLISLSIVVSL